MIDRLLSALWLMGAKTPLPPTPTKPRLPFITPTRVDMSTETQWCPVCGRHQIEWQRPLCPGCADDEAEEDAE